MTITNSKNLTLLLVFLAGCSNLSKYAVTFDPVEYEKYVDVSVAIDEAKPFCSDVFKERPAINELLHRVSVLKTYTYNIGNNQESARMASNLQEIVVNMNDVYTSEVFPHPKFCELTLDSLKDSVDIAMHAIGNKQVK